MKKFLFLIALLLWPVAAPAKVTLTFCSRELGVYFPHAFVRVTGATNAEPDQPIDINYGFTAKAVTPAILLGPVAGEMKPANPTYVSRSDSHFSMVLTDAMIRCWRS